jgi:penicillin amidase
MDLLRRLGSGRLAELAGAALVEQDQANRIFRGAPLADAAFRLLPIPEQDLLVAYTEGVNAGLDSLTVRPPEYLLLRKSPERWQPRDCLILNLTFGFNLQDATGAPDLRRELLRRSLHPAAYAFFVPRGTDRDATLDGHQFPEPRVPTAEEFTAPAPPAAKTNSQSAAVQDASDEPVLPGSNAWALGRGVTQSGAALVADDMHLEITAPGVWYRAVIVWKEYGIERMLAGVTLPGAPTLITGSNGNIAWGFTNSQIDTTDLVELELDPANPNRYRTPDGWREFEVIDEPILVAHSDPIPFKVTNTIWGPVIPPSTNLPAYAACWVMARPAALAPLSFPLENAENVSQALEAAHRTPRPVQNFVVGDRFGNIAWTLIGMIPDRGTGTGEFPEKWSVPGAAWKGTLAPDDFPTVLNPNGARIWTANQRITGDPRYLRFGDGGWDSGARAARIRDDLLSLSNATPADMLAVQLDDTIPLMQPWRDRLVSAVNRLRTESVAGNPTNAVVWDGLAAELRSWNGRATADSTAFLPIARFRRQAHNLLHEPLWWTVRRLDPRFGGTDNQSERTVEILLREKPDHFLNPKFASYEALLDEAARRALSVTNGLPAPPRTWGSANKTSVRHRLSPALPDWLARHLDMEPEPQSGFSYGLPRIAAAGFGASQRFGIIPGDEAASYLHTPAGQSGHFLSPFYRNSHPAWMQGKPTPLLGLAPRHRLTLRPAR